LRNKEGMRWFFDGPIQFDDNEKAHLEKFKAYCEKHRYELKPM